MGLAPPVPLAPGTPDVGFADEADVGALAAPIPCPRTPDFRGAHKADGGVSGGYRVLRRIRSLGDVALWRSKKRPRT